jgi:hypothetical protein
MPIMPRARAPQPSPVRFTASPGRAVPRASRRARPPVTCTCAECTAARDGDIAGDLRAIGWGLLAGAAAAIALLAAQWAQLGAELGR